MGGGEGVGDCEDADKGGNGTENFVRISFFGRMFYLNIIKIRQKDFSFVL